MESTIHPKNVKIGDKLTILYQNDEIEVTVIDEPDEIETLDEDNKGWWQCGIMWKPWLDTWYATWTEDNSVWEIGQK